MAKEKSNYDKLQECSRQVSELIELEQLYRERKVPVNAHELEIPTEMLATLKRQFIETRHKILITLNKLQE